MSENLGTKIEQLGGDKERSNFDELVELLWGDEKHFSNYQEQIPQLLGALFEVFEKHGGRVREVTNTNFGDVFLQSIKKYPIILRRENPVALVRAFVTGTQIKLRPGTHANACFVPERSQFEDNFRTVLTEGFGMVDKMGLVGIVAYDDLSKVQIDQPAVVEHTQYKTNTRRAGDRTVSGEFNVSDIRAILLRMPISKYPQSLMTDDELEKLAEVQSWEEEIADLISLRAELNDKLEKNGHNYNIEKEKREISDQIDKLKNKINNCRVYRVVEFPK